MRRTPSIVMRVATGTYESPTTPGLEVTFRAYVVERVCHNARPDLGPRFWTDHRYGQRKFVRESVALARLLQAFDEDDPVVRRAVLEVVDERRMGTLLTRHLDRDVQRIRAKMQELGAQRETLAAAASEPVHDVAGYVERNRSLSPATRRNRLCRIQEAEGRDEEGNGQSRRAL